MARTYGALSDAEIAWIRNQMSKGAKAAKAGANVKSATKLQNKPKLKKAEPYYDIKSRTTKYSTKGDVVTLQMPKKAKKK